MKQQFITSGIIGNKAEAIGQATEELLWAYRLTDGRAKDAIIAALKHLGTELETEEEAQERSRDLQISMNR